MPQEFSPMQNQTGLPPARPIVTFTLWDKCAVSVVHVSPFLPDLLTNPIQASFNSPLVWSRRVEVATYSRRNTIELFAVNILNPIFMHS
jgi:hypothetical protein